MIIARKYLNGCFYGIITLGFYCLAMDNTFDVFTNFMLTKYGVQDGISGWLLHHYATIFTVKSICLKLILMKILIIMAALNHTTYYLTD